MRNGSSSGSAPNGDNSCRFFILSYAYLAMFALISWKTPTLNSFWFGLWVLLLSTPMMFALWHQSAVRRMIFLHQFKHDTFLHRWGSRRVISVFILSAVAVFASALALLQTVFFAWSEWLILVVAPIVYYVVHGWIRSRSDAQFSKPVYALRWSFWVTQGLFVLGLATIFMCVTYLNADHSQTTFLDRVHMLQSQTNSAPSSVVRWALDAGAFGQAAQETIAHISGRSYWKIVVGFVFAPLSIFGFFALTFSGVSLTRNELRLILSGGFRSSDMLAPVGPVNASIWAAVAAVLVLSYFQLLAYANHTFKIEDSPFAIEVMPPCEKIDGVTYKINTLKTIETLIFKAAPILKAKNLDTCKQFDQLESEIAAGVDDYLNWYFSLGGDYTKLAMMLSGDVDLFLESKFNELALSRMQKNDSFQKIQAAHENQWLELNRINGAIQQVLSQNQLNVGERNCKLVRETSMGQVSLHLDEAKARLSTSAAAGMIGGVFASKLTAKVMAKSTVKLSGKVLLKAVAKKAVGKGAVAVTGAATGAAIGSVVPGLGTAVGAIIGAAAGLTLGIGVDVAILAAEERLTRVDMKKDLVDAIAETLQPMRNTFNCQQQ